MVAMWNYKLTLPSAHRLKNFGALYKMIPLNSY